MSNNPRSMWGGMPSDWQPDPAPYEDNTGSEPYTDDDLNDPTDIGGGTDVVGPEILTAKERKRRASLARQQEKRRKKERKLQQKRRSKQEKQKIKKYDKESRNAWKGESDTIQSIYHTEKRGNIRDLIIIALAIILVMGCAIGFVVFTLNRPSQKIDQLIAKNELSSAYKTIKKYAESGKNVDDEIYSFVDVCIRENQPKRAIAALEYLSDDAVNVKVFFKSLYQTLLDMGEKNRAEDVLQFLDRRGGGFKNIADWIRNSSNIV